MRFLQPSHSFNAWMVASVKWKLSDGTGLSAAPGQSVAARSEIFALMQEERA
jgi:hypothetical protein